MNLVGKWLDGSRTCVRILYLLNTRLFCISNGSNLKCIARFGSSLANLLVITTYEQKNCENK